MFRRARYQQGSLQRIARKRGPDCWFFRWYEIDANGSKRYRKSVVGTVEEYPTEASAQNAISTLRFNINQQAPRSEWQPYSVKDLINHYKETELRIEQSEGEPDEDEKAYSTKKTSDILKWAEINMSQFYKSGAGRYRGKWSRWH